ncbi:hypothetical protein DHEL01_v208187 [Diaporthe helianthi]|uniref:Ras family protein n=1 Tax=Diaporthe helianthi TaxID=158607 RepID=A0A2P5HT40_DIAHE|nr:hypothetical protein DHEL01_v208187 [Diaporthe helianthi]
MAKETTANPTVRILVIGTAGAGKNCLESRFSTSQFPPPYDPSLTLCSRRFLTLERNSSNEGGSRSSSLPELRVLTDFRASSASLLSPPDSAGPASPISDPVSPISFVSNTSTLDTSTTSIPGSPSFGTELEPPKPQPCSKCTHRASTYLVEVVNYPALQSAKVRQHVLCKGEYDAVLLVYDITDRRSFDKVREFHAEVSLVDSNGNNHHKRQRSQAPRRHPGTPNGPPMQRRNSMMSFFSPGDGLVGSEEDVEVGKGSGGGGVVVALVGNKADIGEEDGDTSEEDGEEDGRLEQDDDFDDDCESALAVFGDALHGKLHEKVKLGTTFGTTSRTNASHTGRSETVERWLQIVGKATEEDRKGAALEASSQKVTASKAKPKRTVSKCEGEDMARSLELQVPFFETSARSGANVEEAFEAIVRSVLRKMGRSATPSEPELAKRCRQKHEAEQQKRAGVSRSSRSVDRLTQGAGGLVRGAGYHRRLVLDTKVDGQGHADHLERPAPVQNVPGRESIPRRESFMERMRRMLAPEEVRSGDKMRRSPDGHPARSS